MDWRKRLSFLFDRNLASGFSIGVFASLLLIFLLSSADTSTTTTSASVFSWFKTQPWKSFQDLNANSSKVPAFALSAPGLGFQRYHGGSRSNSSLNSTTSPSSSFYDYYSVAQPDLGKTHEANLTWEGNDSSNYSVRAGGNISSSIAGEIIPPGNFTRNNNTNEDSNYHANFGEKSAKSGTSSLSNASLPSSSVTESDSGKTHSANQTWERTNSNNSVNNDENVSSSGETSPLQKAHEGNYARNGNPVDKGTTFELKDSNGNRDQQIKQPYGEGESTSQSKEASGNDKVSNSGKFEEKGGLNRECNIFDGRWVRDESRPYYEPGSCPYLDDDFNCYKNGRPDHDFLNWRWQPNRCNIPRLNGTDFLERLRGKRILFVGDSLNRNMWESLVCILRHCVSDKSKVYEASGRKQFKTRGYYSFRFKDYKCAVDFVRSTFLVKELYQNGNGNGNGSEEDERLRLDVLDETTVAYRKADILVFNTGHWWTHEKTSKGINYYQEGKYVYPVLKVLEAYKKALTTWAKWIDDNINPQKTLVVFRGYSLTHFRGGQWNSGGRCHKEREPIFNQSYLSHYPSKMRALEHVLRHMKTPVIYLNISRLTDYRKDGHPSIYRKRYNTIQEQIAAEKSQDCSHWCLPGVPDSWNELLYASLLLSGKGSWRIAS